MPVTDTTGGGADGYRTVRLWLYVLAAIVLLMVMVGGATRLTGSGLSITEWRPIMGAVPPLSDAEWQEAFAKYKQIPQYQQLNKGMSLTAFKVIFWWEWGHRFLGRFLGIVFAVPFLWFLAKGKLGAGLATKLLAIAALGGAQGYIGWFMVQSGLAQRTSVSQYRLALHLGIAALILAGLVWTALSLRPRRAGAIHLATVTRGQRLTALALVGLVLLQIVSGAFVAGMQAGLSHNTWPLMDGRIVPGGLGAMSPWWVNLFENAATVQFDHRMLAYLLLAFALWHAWSVMRTADDERVRRTATLLAGAVLGQLALGIWTLLAMVPIGLALAHQAAAFALLLVALVHAHGLVRR